jgi:hypothetical protein
MSSRPVPRGVESEFGSGRVFKSESERLDTPEAGRVAESESESGRYAGYGGIRSTWWGIGLTRSILVVRREFREVV